MIQKTGLLVILSLVFINLKAQITFYGGYNSGTAVMPSCIPTSDKGYIFTGSTSSSGQGNNDILVAKIDSLGNQEWSKTYGGPGDDYASSIIEVQNKEYVICGTAEDGGLRTTLFVSKIDSSGSTIWANSYDYMWTQFTGANCIKQTEDGGFILCGSGTTGGSPMTYQSDIMLWKLDSAGQVSWSKRYYSVNDQDGRYIQQTSDKGYIIIADDGQVNIMRTDSMGNVLWNKGYGGSLQFPRYVEETTDSGFVIVGTASYNVSPDGNGFIMKINSSGNILWTKLYGGPGFETFESAQITKDNGIIATGFSNSSGFGETIIVKTDSNGDSMWTKSYHDSLTSSSLCILETGDGFIISGNDGNDNYILKTDEFGNADCYKSAPYLVVQNPTIPNYIVNVNSVDSSLFGSSTASITEAIAGTFSTGCLSLNTNRIISENDFNIYPNPSDGILNLELKFPMKNAIVQIVNVLGIITNEFQFELLNTAVIQTGNLTPGLYWINVVGENQRYTKKILIQN